MIDHWALAVLSRGLWQGGRVPANTAELVDLLNLQPVDERSFRGHHPQTLMQRTYGGQVLAQALTAAYGTVSRERVVHSLHAYFVRPGSASADIDYRVQNSRDGKTFRSRRVVAYQGYEELFSMSCSFHAPEPGLDHGDPAPERVPAPEDCPTLVEVMDARFGVHPIWHEWDVLEVRFAGDSGPGGVIASGAHRAHMRVWVRTEARLPDDIRVHQAILAYLSDLTLLSVSTVPHEVAFMSNRLQTASIDHVMWFHRRFMADEWLLYDMISPSASHALGFASGRLFQGGRMVASCAQEGLIRPVAGGSC